MRMRLVLMLILALGTVAVSAAPSQQPDSTALAGLIAAVDAKDLTRVRAYLDAGVDPNAVLRENYGSEITPLLASMWSNSPPIAEELLRLGAVVDRPSHSGMTPLIGACYRGNLDFVKLLLRHHANPNAQRSESSFNGWLDTPLIASVSTLGVDSRAEIVRVLLAAGADPNLSVPGGESPLLHACAQLYTDAEAIRLLLKAGARPRRRDALGRTALMRGVLPKSDRVGEFDLKVLSAFVESGAHRDVCDSLGTTPLMLSAACGSPEGVRLLLDAGVDVEARDASGRTALMYAAGWLVDRFPQPITLRTMDLDGVIRLLLERGAKADARDDAGRTALDWAIKERREEAAAILRARGRD